MPDDADISPMCGGYCVYFGVQSGGAAGNRSRSNETDEVEIGMATTVAASALCRCRFQSSMMPA